mmetsp:Transcript_22863/g.32681  ORF Transcript_22863/g.32681 Transcript_22863/m.32681 type:complete len:95 (-) Transcript_22863:399-683(-)
MKRGSNPACCQVKDCQNKYTTMCQYHNRGSPGELIKKEVVGYDRYKNRYLPMHCLLEDHLAEMKEENNDDDYNCLGESVMEDILLAVEYTEPKS